jgi:ABC-type phosphate/phosphonate transport system substrate-binding protein
MEVVMQSTRLTSSIILGTLALCAMSGRAGAAEAGTQRVGFAPTTAAAPALLERSAAPAASSGSAPYVFSAPPRESAQAAAEIYGPIAEYLSKVTGKNVVYRHAGNWIAYQTEMRRGDYDLVFDGPHLNGWRAANLQHHILVKAPGEHSFVVAVKKDNDRIRELKQLAGRAICGMSPPNLGTLTVLNEFDNPARQPIIQNTESWGQIYEAMASGRCAAAILPARQLAKLDPQGVTARVLYKAKAYPNQALSASPRVTAEDQAKIARAMTLPDARAAAAKLREAYALNGDFQAASRDEYTAMAAILKDSWGY